MPSAEGLFLRCRLGPMPSADGENGYEIADDQAVAANPWRIATSEDDGPPSPEPCATCEGWPSETERGMPAGRPGMVACVLV